MMKK
jgi:hypothetical protein